MGKTRKDTKSTPNRNTEPVYTTDGGKKIYNDSYSHKFYHKLQRNIEKWVDFEEGKTPDENLTADELQYVYEHMANSESTLTRVEPRTRNFVVYTDGKFDHELKEGEIFDFNGELKAFSRDISATNKYIDENYARKDLVIYRTPKGTPQFNVTEWNDDYKWEQEGWITSKNWKVDKIEDVSENYPNNFRVKMVDISPIE